MDTLTGVNCSIKARVKPSCQVQRLACLLPRNERGFFFHMIQPPKVRYTFDIKDATLFYSAWDNSINIETQESIEFEDGLCITGIEPETVFMMCRNVLANKNKPIQYEFKANDHHVESAKDMITALQEFVNSKEKKDDTATDS